tara:strand:+ start:241 stop:702 length:462 start_codon:yes stop_codon:yes gene_type:complete
MKLIFFSFSLFFLLFIPQVVFADETKIQGVLVPVTGSCDCLIKAQMEIRNSSDQLTAVIIPRIYFYLDHQLTQELLSQTPVTEQISLNQKQYDVREFNTEIKIAPNNHFLDRIGLTKTTEYGKIQIFYATEIGYHVSEGDTLKTKWKIMTRIN